jgi:hypothetical protein
VRGTYHRMRRLVVAMRFPAACALKSTEYTMAREFNAGTTDRDAKDCCSPPYIMTSVLVVSVNDTNESDCLSLRNNKCLIRNVVQLYGLVETDANACLLNHAAWGWFGSSRLQARFLTSKRHERFRRNGYVVFQSFRSSRSHCASGYHRQHSTLR